MSGHLHASVAFLSGKEESLVPTEQEVGWSGHYVVHRARIQSLYRLKSLARSRRGTDMSSLVQSAPTGMRTLHAFMLSDRLNVCRCDKVVLLTGHIERPQRRRGRF